MLVQKTSGNQSGQTARNSPGKKFRRKSPRARCLRRDIAPAPAAHMEIEGSWYVSLIAKAIVFELNESNGTLPIHAEDCNPTASFCCAVLGCVSIDHGAGAGGNTTSAHIDLHCD